MVPAASGCPHGTDSPVLPSFAEVFILLYGAFAIYVDYTKLRTSFLALVAINNTFVINIINAHIYETASLPGSNGSATRGNVTIAGDWQGSLIWRFS